MLIQCVTHVGGRDKKVVKALITSLYTTLSEDGMRVEEISDLLLLSSKANFKKMLGIKLNASMYYFLEIIFPLSPYRLVHQKKGYLTKR